MRIHIVPTYVCNLACDFCYAKGFVKKYPDPMSLDLFMEIFEYCRMHGVKSISFLGGEPTLWPQLDYAINYARGNGAETIIFSNGTEVNGIPHLAVLNITRFLAGPFSKKVLDNIKWYRDNGVQLNFRINLSKDTTDRYLHNVLQIAGDHNADIQFAAIECSPGDRIFGDKIYEWLHTFVEKSFHVRISRPLLKCVFIPEQYKFITDKCSCYPKCDFDNTVPVINPDGKTVFPCNSITVPLPIEYLWSERNKFTEIRYIQSNFCQFIPSECIVCEEYKSNQCHGGCIGAQINKLYNPAAGHKKKPEGNSVFIKPAKSFEWDWGLAAKVIARSINNNSVPVSGYIKLGYECNNHCDFCTVEWEKGLGNRTYSEIINEIDLLLKDSSISVMHYSGGEPTIRKELPQILGYVRNKGIKHQIIQTNGRMLENKDYLKLLIDSGATSFYVSIHGADSFQHDSLVNADSAFDQTIRGLQNLESIGVKFSTNTVITKQNFQSLGKIIQLIAREFPSVSKAKLSYPNIRGGASDNLDKVIVPLWDCIRDIKNAIYAGLAGNIFIDTESVPICLLGELSDHACELVRNIYNISDLHYHENGWTINQRAKGFVFYDTCSECDVKRFCSGINPLHDKVFKFKDVFYPVTFSQIGKSGTSHIKTSV